MNRRRRALGVFSVLAVLLVGCTDYLGDDVRASGQSRSGSIVAFGPVGTATVEEEAPPRPVDPTQLQTGDCFDDPEGSSDLVAFPLGATVEQVPCSRPHRYEVYATPLLLAPGTWPGEMVAGELADQACSEAFDEFVGVAWSQSTLDYLVLAPSEARWEADDTVGSCALFDLGLVALTGTMSGSQR